MEILIIGGIVVALMVYVSTKIKKASQLAYEPEVFETEDFIITKPDGFLIPINEESEYAFEAYSKDLGIEETQDFYQCQAVMKVKSDSKSRKTSVVESERAEKNVTLKLFNKTLSNPKTKKTYELEIQVLPDFIDTYQNRINELLNTFAIK